MPDAFETFDRVEIFLSGGASNQDPSASLGGEISTRRTAGMSVRYTDPIQSLIVEDATSENGEGLARIDILEDGTVAYTPPGGGQGASISIDAGERTILQGSDTTKQVRVFRQSSGSWGGTSLFQLLDPINGVISMEDVVDADRQSGDEFFRAFFLKAQTAVANVKIWIEAPGQSSYSIAKEVPSGSSIQTISTSKDEPSGVSWVDATTQETALDFGDMSQDNVVGVWVRRTFPASGDASLNEEVTLNLQFNAVG